MLEINLSDVKSKPVLNLGKRMRKRFRPGSQNDMSDAVYLACYLYFMGKSESAIKLLKSFLYYKYEDKPELQRDLWFENCQGLVLLTYIQKQENIPLVHIDLDLYMGSDSLVAGKKYMKDRLKIALEENPKSIELAETETPKYQCQLYAQEVLSFMPIVVLWPYFAKDSVLIGFKLIKLTDVKNILNNNVLLLQQSLKKYC